MFVKQVVPACFRKLLCLQPKKKNRTLKFSIGQTWADNWMLSNILQYRQIMFLKRVAGVTPENVMKTVVEYGFSKSAAVQGNR